MILVVHRLGKMPLSSKLLNRFKKISGYISTVHNIISCHGTLARKEIWHVSTLARWHVTCHGTLARKEIWPVGTLARRHVTCHGTLAHKEIWHAGTLARWHVTCHGTLARKKIWHVGTLARLARLARNLADSS